MEISLDLHKMADPLSQLRQFHINGREIKEHGDFIIFGDHGWPKTVKTNYQIYQTEDDKSKKEYYTLECLLYFLKNVELAHHHYVKQAGRDEKPVVHRPDRKNILAYLNGEQQIASSIDKNAPIPLLRLSAAEIYKKAGEPQPSTSQSNSQNSNDPSRSSNSSQSPKKRPHDPEMEKKFRADFAARLYEPSTKKLATIIPTESVEKGGEAAEGSAAISKFGAEKLAALRAKHLAVKRTTIIDADISNQGSGAIDSGSREAELLIAMDSDSSKLIRSKEKVWRTRSSILQAQSKNFAKTVLPLVEMVGKIENPSKRMPPEMDVTSYTQQQQQQQQQQAMQRNSAYNRYDQERFVKLDIGVEIDTKKSFVSGVTNGLSTIRPNAPTPINDPSRPIDNISSRPKSIPTKPTKRISVVPIIIIPATTTSLINMRNASAILQDLTYTEGSPNKARENEILIQRKKPDGTHVPYKILDNPIKLDAEDWKRVVAVFVQGPAWQFKGWPWGGSPVEIFSRIKGFHLKWDDQKLDDNVAKWNVHILELSHSKRHLDKANLLKFWSSLDVFMNKYKGSYLKF